MNANDHDPMHELLCAYILGETSEEQTLEIETALAASAELRAQRVELERTIGLVRHGLGDSLSLSDEAMTSLLAVAAAPGQGAPVASLRPWHASPVLRAAAGIVALGGVLGVLAMRDQLGSQSALDVALSEAPSRASAAGTNATVEAPGSGGTPLGEPSMDYAAAEAPGSDTGRTLRYMTAVDGLAPAGGGGGGAQQLPARRPLVLRQPRSQPIRAKPRKGPRRRHGDCCRNRRISPSPPTVSMSRCPREKIPPLRPLAPRPWRPWAPRTNASTPVRETPFRSQSRAKSTSRVGRKKAQQGGGQKWPPSRSWSIRSSRSWSIRSNQRREIATPLGNSTRGRGCACVAWAISIWK